MCTFSGKVIHGDGYGRKLGFPTANMNIQNETLTPGVYAGFTSFMSRGILDTYRAAILINPTGKIEAHLLDFNDDLYGKMITLEVGKFIREYKSFDTEEELINQIKEDVKLC